MAKQFEPFVLEEGGMVYEVRKGRSEDLWYLISYDDTAPLPFAWDKDRGKVVALAERVKSGAVDPFDYVALKAEAFRLGFEEERA